MISCEIELDLTWSKECIISKISVTSKVHGDNPVVAIKTTGAIVQINNANLYVLVVTFAVNDDIKFIENIKQGFRNKYRFETTTQTKNNKLDLEVLL